MSTFVWYIVVFLFIIRRSLCASDSITTESNVQSRSSLSDSIERKIDTEHVTSDQVKANKEGSSVYNTGQLEFNEQKWDEKRYDEQDTARKGHDKGRHSLEESEVVDHERNSFERHGGGYYKKGHRRTGFSNNYHKDESGNNSSFYEDTDDEGGHRSSGNSGGYYGQKSRDSFRDGARDITYAERDRAEQGIYDNRQNFNGYYDHVGGYNNDRYEEDRRNYLRDEAKRSFDKNDGEMYYHREKYHPIIYRNNDHIPSPFGYSRYYVDTLPGGYYREDPVVIPHSRDYRYFPHRRRNYDRKLLYYPRRGYFEENYPDGFYGNGYLSKYRNGFYDGYNGP